MSDLFDLPFEDDPEPEPEPEPERVAAPPPARRVLSVTELTIQIRDRLESAFFEVWVEGEISNCRLWNTGHLFFTLKDQSSQVRGFMFRSALRYLKFKPADGLRVVARGKISVYEPKGEYQIVCEHLEPQGLGALQLAFEQLKKRLQAEGLFDTARKRPLPALPRKIGIVTSLDGAAIRDIIKVLARRHVSAQIVIRPARVQGEDAAPDIARAIRMHRTRAGRRRHHRRTRRRVDRRSVGVQRGNGRARDRALAGAGHFRRRPRNRRHDRRLRRRSPRADAVGGGRDRRRRERRVLRRGSTGSRSASAPTPVGRCSASAGACTSCRRRSALAGFPGRVALRDA